MKPRPAVMSLTKPACNAVARYAPAMPHSTPQINTAEYRSHTTEMPAVSTAAGFSPTARNRRPYRVRNNTHQVSATMPKEAYTKIV